MNDWVRVKGADHWLNVALLREMRIDLRGAAVELRASTIDNADLVLGRYETRAEALAVVEQMLGPAQ